MGFRDKHSAAHQLVRLTKLLAENFSRNAAAIFLGTEKPFYRAWPEGIIFKLSTSPIPIYISKILYSFLASRTLNVTIGNSISSKHPIIAGMPQGSLLPPILYNLFAYDLPSLPNTQSFLYADDVVIAWDGVVPRFTVKKTPATAERS
jgi:hypothetical protein